MSAVAAVMGEARNAGGNKIVAEIRRQLPDAETKLRNSKNPSSNDRRS